MADHDPTDRPLHVLELCTWFTAGGIGRHVLTLGDYLSARGHRVSLGGAPGIWANETITPGFLALDLIAVGGRGGALPRRLWAAARAALRLRRWLRAERPDVIHAHDSTPAFVARLARTGLGIPLIVTYHGSEPERIRDFARTAQGCDLTVTPSHRSGEDLVRIGRLPADRLRVIGLGVRPPAPVSAEAVARCRNDHLRGGDRLIVTIARLVPQKGIDMLLDCAARLAPLHPGWRFVIAGDGPDEAALCARVLDLGLQGQVSFIGRTDQPHLLLRAADLFLLTSRWEALPFTIVEAFQAGTPAIATACSGVVELIDDQVGRVVPVGDVPAICGALERVLGNEALRRNLAAAALGRSHEDRFNPDWVHPQFERLYRELASARPAR